MPLANLSTVANDCYIGGSFYIMWWLAGDSSMKTGYLIADHATNDAEVIICATGGTPFGTAALQPDVDIDTAFTDATMYSFYALHAGTALWAGYEDAVKAIKQGENCSRSAATAGTIASARTAGVVVGRFIETDDAVQNEWVRIISQTQRG